MFSNLSNSVNGDPSLKQGQQFNQLMGEFTQLVEPQLAVIERGSPPVIEGLENAGDSATGVDGRTGVQMMEDISDSELNTLGQLEKQYTDTLAQYKVAFGQYLTELSSKQNSPSLSYKGKVITADGKNYWVNNLGYARLFSTDAWSGKNSSCPASSATVSLQALSGYPQGVGMGIGERCMNGGVNVKMSNGGGTAWVDAQGNKHNYQDFRNRNKSCPEVSTSVTPNEFNAIPTGKIWTSADSCSTLATSDKLTAVTSLNQKLMNLGKQMNDQVKIIKQKNQRVDSNITEQKSALVEKTAALNKEREKINALTTSIQTMSGELDDKRLEVSSVYLHYMVWFLAFVTLGGVAVQQVLKN